MSMPDNFDMQCLSLGLPPPAPGSTQCGTPPPKTLGFQTVDTSAHLCMKTYGDGPRVRCSTGSPNCVDGIVQGKDKFLYPVSAQLLPCTQEGLENKTMISVNKAFGGDLLDEDFADRKDVYACVWSGDSDTDMFIFSGLAAFVIDDAVNLPCSENYSKLKKIDIQRK